MEKEEVKTKQIKPGDSVWVVPLKKQGKVYKIDGEQLQIWLDNDWMCFVDKNKIERL